MSPKPRNERSSVGDRLRDGALSGGVRGGQVWVNAVMLGTGVTVFVDPDEAQDFADLLYVWGNAAREARRHGRQS